MIFSDLHVQLIARGVLQPGEQLVGQTVTSHMPWWALGFIRRTVLVLATTQRIILAEHRPHWFFWQYYQLHSIDSIPLAQLQEVKVKGLLKKKLRIRGQGERGPVNMTHVIPNTLFGLLAPMKNNMQGAKAIAAAVGQGAAPQLPPQNAPGYASLPPAAAGPYGAAPPHFAPPAQGNPPRSWS